MNVISMVGEQIGMGDNSARLGQAAQANAEDLAWRQGFIQEVAALAASSTQPQSAAWATSVIRGRLRNPHFLGLLDRFHHLNPGATAPEARRRFLSAEQAQFLNARSDSRWKLPPYPSTDYEEPELWHKGSQLINRTPPYDSLYYHDLIRRDLTTSVSQRTVAVRFLRRTLAHLLPDEPFRASCGPGDMAGDRRDWLSSRDPQFRFDRVRVMDERKLGGLAVSAFKSDIFNAIIDEPDATKRVVGYDRVNPSLPTNKAWTLACATPEEILSGKMAELHDRIMSADVPDSWLGFRLADLSKKTDVKAVVKAEGQADIVSEILCWYEGSADARRRKFRHMFEEIMKPDGVGISAEFARRTYGNTYLMPNPKWSDFNIFVVRAGQLYRVMTFTDGRCHEVRVLKELGELARGGPHEHDVAQLLA